MRRRRGLIQTVEGLRPESRAAILADYVGIPVVEYFTSADLERSLNVRGPRLTAAQSQGKFGSPFPYQSVMSAKGSRHRPQVHSFNNTSRTIRGIETINHRKFIQQHEKEPAHS
jgi:hypothetical protein